MSPEAALKSHPDCSVICTDHSAFDYDQMVAGSTLLVDSRNALKGRKDQKIFRL